MCQTVRYNFISWIIRFAASNLPVRLGMAVICLSWAYLVVACTVESPPPTPTLTPGPVGELTPYSTPIPSQTPLPPTPLVKILLTPEPTATPFTHQVVKGETMLGIALRYGIKLEDLRAANPTVDPRIMSVGTLLVIPLQAGTPSVVPTATPVPVALSTPSCYPAGDGGDWCLVEVNNDRLVAVENLSVWIGLYSNDGENLDGQTVAPLLNLLPAGKMIPLLVYFPSPLPEEVQARAELLTALDVPPDDRRYLPVSAQSVAVEISLSGEQAAVKGQVFLPVPVRWLWVLVVAYNEQGEPVGLRKWEAASPCGEVWPTPPTSTPEIETVLPVLCEPVAFDTTVFSLGPPIRQVQVFVEARP